MRRLAFLFLLILIPACSPFVTSTPPPSPQPLSIAYTPALRPYVEKLHRCALEHPEIGLITQETNTQVLEKIGAEVVLWFGEPPNGVPGFAFSLGEDQIIMIAGTDVALTNLNQEDLKDLYSNQNPTFQVWTYGPDNELRSIFDQAVLGEIPTSPNALLAPSPAAMLEAVSANPMAVGYLSASWLTGDIKIITVDQELQSAFSHPILALTTTEPTGYLKSFLFCMQNTAPKK